MHKVGDDWGEFDEEDDGSLVIKVDADISGHMLRTTVYHEFLHYVFYISGLSHLLKDLEEPVIRAIENLALPSVGVVEEALEEMEKE